MKDERNYIRGMEEGIRNMGVSVPGQMRERERD